MLDLQHNMDYTNLGSEIAIQVIEDIIRWHEDMNFIFEW